MLTDYFEPFVMQDWKSRLGRVLLSKRERYRAHVRRLLRYPFQNVRYMVGSIQMCSQCNDVSALSQTEVIPLFTFGIHFERCFTLFPKWGFVPKVDTLLFYW